MSDMTVNGVGGTRGVAAAQQANMTSEDIADAGELLPEVAPLLNGDVGAQIAALSILSGREQRKLAKTLRAVEENALQAAESAEIDAMHEKADKDRMASLVGGLSTAASGGLEMSTAIPRANEAALKGGGKSTEGLGKCWAALEKSGADGADRGAKSAEQLASREKRALEDTRDLDDAAKKHMEKVLDLYKEYSNAKQDAERAAIMRA